MLRPLPSLVVYPGSGTSAKPRTDVALFARKFGQTVACLGLRIEESAS